MAFSLESLYKSLVRQVSDIMQELIDTDLAPNMTYFSWDSRAVSELPSNDLIGMIGWTYDHNEGLPVIQMGILLSMINDKNMFREAKVLDVIRSRCIRDEDQGYKTWSLVDPTDASEYSLLQISNFEIQPAGFSELRTTRNIGIELIRTGGN